MRIIKIVFTLCVLCSSAVFAQGPPPAQVVVTKIIQQEVSENRSFLGLLYYDRISHVSSEVSGLVEKVEVRESDLVKKGDPLVSLDTEMLDKGIALQRSRMDRIDLQIRHEEKNFKRLEKLFAKDGVSEKDYEDALYEYQDALKEKQTEETELEKLQIQKRKSVIEAPFDGVILEKSIDIGDWVQQGKQLVRIACTEELFVRVPVSETILRFVTVGQKVAVTINAYNKELLGTIDDVDTTADAKTKNVFLKVRIPAMTKVAENMSATVFVPTSERKLLSIIPRDALIKFQGKDFVYTVKDGKAALLPVNIVTYLDGKIGADNTYFTPGMPIVTEGNERLQPDQPVVIAEKK